MEPHCLTFYPHFINRDEFGKEIIPRKFSNKNFFEGAVPIKKLSSNGAAARKIFQGISRKIIKIKPSGLAQIAFPGLSTNDFRTIFDGN